MMKVKTVERAAIPDISLVQTVGSKRRGFLARAAMPALLLSLALNACGEQDEESAETSEPSAQLELREETATPLAEDLPLVDLDAGEAAEEFPAQDPASAMLAELPLMPPQPVVPNLVTITRVRALDKITARVIELDLPEDTEVRFGTLAIRARTCRSRPPEEPPETFAFLEIDDVNADHEYERVFAGWMMASSPALNALEHSVYDVWVIACSSSSAEASSASE